jgi:ribosomal protein S6
MEFKNQRRYVGIFAYVPSINPEKINLQIEEFKKLINSLSGKLEHSEYLGLKNLAYEILKHKKAHYIQYYWYFNINENLQKNISEIKRKMNPNLNTSVVRFLVMQVDHKDIFTDSLKKYEGFNNQIKID